MSNLRDAPKTAMPRKVKPMLATAVDASFDRPGWVFEIKWDGYRAIAELDKNVRLYSRNLLSFEERYAPVVESLRQLKHRAVLDGEVVVLDNTGVAQFQLLQNYQKTRKGPLVYYVFDLLWLDGHDLQDLPLLRRKEILADILRDFANVKLSEHIEEHGKAFFEVALAREVEGVVAKNGSSRYRQGKRSDSWLKIKARFRQECVIGGFTQPRGSRKHFGALVLGVYDGDRLIYAGRSGSGFTEQGLADVHAQLVPLMQSACPFPKRPQTDSPARWVRPELVCEVAFVGWTDDGHMRHPIFQGLREDKPAKSVRRETPRSAHQILATHEDR